MKGHEGVVYRFGQFLLVPGERRLLHGGELVALAGKPFDLPSRCSVRLAIWRRRTSCYSACGPESWSRKSI